MRYPTIPVLIGALALLLGLAASFPAAASPEEILDNAHLQKLARGHLDSHVDAADLRAWRDTCSQEEAAAFDFIFAWLPPADLASYRSPQIISDIRLALQTRGEVTWGRDLPDRIFYTYVLPHRVAQEPVQAWRPKLHDLLLPRVRGLSLREAALELNRFCREWATFQPTSSRDQGPLTTMERGRGRCEEETIFFICAARSVGIPARPCYTPWWMASDNNHAWVEVWTGEGWHYLGACEPAPDLDQAWFSGPARRTGLVLAVAYGEADFTAEDVYALDKGTTLLNVTPTYNRTGTLRVAVTAPGGSSSAKDTQASGGSPAGRGSAAVPADSVTVHLHVFNSGCLVELAQCLAGRSLALGAGDYIAAWEARGAPQTELVTIRPGQETMLSIDPAKAPARPDWMEKPFWLHIPIPSEPGKPPAPTRVMADPGILQAHELAIAQRDLLRSDQSRIEDPLVARIASHLCQEAPLAALLGHFREAGIQADKWATFLAATPGDTFEISRGLISRMDDKDFFECDTSSARTAVRRALKLRSWWQERGVSIPDSIWMPFVLSPRIDLQPGDLGSWVNLPFLLSPKTDSLAQAARECHLRFSQSLRRAGPSRLGHVARPSETWLSTAATPAAARVGLVGLLRRNGIPARVDAQRRWVEFWTGERWSPLDPFGTRPSADEASAMSRAYEEPAQLEARILDLGAPAADEEEPEDLGLARFDHGRFEPLWIEAALAGGVLRCPLEPGEYWLFAGRRNSSGSPHIVARRIAARAGEKVKCTLDLGIPVDEWAAADLAPRKLSPEAVDYLRGFFAEPAAAGSAGMPLLAFVWGPGNEPSRRTAEALEDHRSAWAHAPMAVLSLCLARDGAAGGTDLLSGKGARGPYRSWAINPEDLASLLGVDTPSRLPLLILIDSQGRTLLCLEGMQTAPGPLIKKALGPN